MARTPQIDAHIAQLRSDAAALTSKREALALALIESPKDSSLRKALAALDKDLAEISGELAIHSSGRNAALRRDAVDERAALLAGLKASRDAAVEAALARARLGAEIEAVIAQLKPLLDKWEALSTTCRGEAASVAQTCMGQHGFHYHGNAVMSNAMALTGGVGPALVSALRSAGLGHNGISVGGLFGSVEGGRGTIKDAALLDANKLAWRLDELIEAKEKNHAKADEQVQAENLHAWGRIASVKELITRDVPPKD